MYEIFVKAQTHAHIYDHTSLSKCWKFFGFKTAD